MTTSATPWRAQRPSARKRDTLRYLRAGAIWTALPVRDQRLLLWLLGADVVTAQLAALLVYGQLRTAQRRLARLVEYGLVAGFWAAGVQRPRGRYAYALTPAARADIERLVWPDGFSFGPDGWVYVTDSQVNRILFKSKAEIARTGPHVIYRFKALAPGTIAR